MSESFEHLKAEWDKKLAAEGMPGELESIAPEEEHTPAFDAAVSDLFIHYATTATGDHFVHRQALDTLRSRLRAGGGTDEEVEMLSEDFAREVEDTVTELQKNALEYARTIAAARPMLASRPELIAKMVTTKLKEETGGTIAEAALMELAERASAKLH